jgi:hypothetical protein
MGDKPLDDDPSFVAPHNEAAQWRYPQNRYGGRSGGGGRAGMTDRALPRVMRAAVLVV